MNPSLHLLIVEDNEDLRDILAETLSLAGFDAAAFESAEAALLWLANDPRVDVALVDMMMPGMDGNAFIAALRKGPYRHVPVVGMTAGSHKFDDVVATVAKPFEVDDLAELLAHAAAPRRDRQRG